MYIDQCFFVTCSLQSFCEVACDFLIHFCRHLCAQRFISNELQNVFAVCHQEIHRIDVCIRHLFAGVGIVNQLDDLNYAVIQFLIEDRCV